MDEYLSIGKEAFYQFTERRSKFIGYIKPVKTETDALDFINEIKEKHWDATHNVYAYILNDGKKTRYSDDGEPHGTAGLPVLEVLQKNNLVDVVAVVTRYFGGTLLGTGGLVRAYSNAVSMAIKKSKIIKFKLCGEFQIVCDYNQFGKLSNVISESSGFIYATDFAEGVKINFYIQCEKENFLKKQILEATSGKINPKKINEKFYVI
ncbi:MAG: IMPACT family member YigZ [Eubacteriales bacterium SKADARSKE-1]|nr:IMPACT family member YigZ [Eubacteriales bacterium SKADARSKE-1]